MVLSPEELAWRKQLGEALRVARKKARVTQAEVAQAARVNRSFIAAIEQGGVAAPQRVLKAYEEVMNILVWNHPEYSQQPSIVWIDEFAAPRLKRLLIDFVINEDGACRSCTMRWVIVGSKSLLSDVGITLHEVNWRARFGYRADRHPSSLPAGTRLEETADGKVSTSLLTRLIQEMNAPYEVEAFSTFTYVENYRHFVFSIFHDLPVEDCTINVYFEDRHSRLVVHLLKGYEPDPQAEGLGGSCDTFVWPFGFARLQVGPIDSGEKVALFWTHYKNHDEQDNTLLYRPEWPRRPRSASIDPRVSKFAR